MNILNEILKIVETTKIGDKYRAYCPYHDDRGTPNLFIYPETNSFFCFACSEGGLLKKLYNTLTGKEWAEKNITFEKKEVDCKDRIKFIASEMFYDRLYQKENKEQILNDMKQFDNQLDLVNKVSLKDMFRYLSLCKKP